MRHVPLIGILTLVAGSGYATGQSCDPPCTGIGHENFVWWEFEFSSGDYSLVDSECVAAAVAYSTDPCPADGDGFNEMDGIPFGNGENFAFALSHRDPEGRLGHIHCFAETAITAGQTEIVGYSDIDGAVVATCCSGNCSLPTGSWAAYTASWAEISGSGPFTLTVGSVAGFGPSGPVDTIRRSGILVFIGGGAPLPTTSSIALWAIGDDVLMDGFTYNSSTDEYEGSLVVAGSDAESVEFVTIDFDDDRMDVDGDGRFNELDVSELSSNIGSTDPSLIPALDFDGSGAISQADVDALQRFVDAELDSGLVGDYDGDGNADCADLAAMGSSWNFQLGDVNYRIEIDADLDGDNDAADYIVVYDLLQPADVNDDGAVNSQDVTAYLNLFNAQDPAADVNGDGVVNTIDWIAFLNFWNNPC